MNKYIPRNSTASLIAETFLVEEDSTNKKDDSPRKEDGVEMQWETVSFAASTAACRSQHFPGDSTCTLEFSFKSTSFLVSQLLNTSRNVCTITYFTVLHRTPMGRPCVYYTWRFGVNKGDKIAPCKTIDERIKANLLRWHDVCGIHLRIRSGIDHMRLHPLRCIRLSALIL